MADPEIAKAIKRVEGELKTLKKLAGVKDDPDEELEELEKEPVEMTREVGRGRKKRTVPSLGGQLGDEEADLA